MVQKRRTLRKPTWEKIKGSENQLTDTAMKSKCFGEIKVGKRQPKKRKQKPWRRKRRMRRRIRRVEWERKTEWLTFERMVGGCARLLERREDPSQMVWMNGLFNNAKSLGNESETRDDELWTQFSDTIIIYYYVYYFFVVLLFC